jgi:hypothetical protein
VTPTPEQLREHENCASDQRLRPVADAWDRARILTFWLEQEGFPRASVEMFNDGSGIFHIPLNEEPPDDSARVLDELETRIGYCERTFIEGEGVHIAFCCALRR